MGTKKYFCQLYVILNLEREKYDFFPLNFFPPRKSTIFTFNIGILISITSNIKQGQKLLIKNISQSCNQVRRFKENIFKKIIKPFYEQRNEKLKSSLCMHSMYNIMKTLIFHYVCILCIT